VDLPNSKITLPISEFDYSASGGPYTIDVTGGGYAVQDYSIDMNNITISSTASNYYSTVLGSNYNYGNVTISNGAYNTWATAQPSLQVTGEAKFDGDVIVQGKSLADFMKAMEKRLAILVPNPEKLEHFEALQKAYAHYKTLEALCELPSKDEDGSV
jgi:hypothetical protein